MKIPELVAHRGHAAHYPENTLPAIESALRVGACYVEVDIQLTADGVPVLLHDDEMTRTTGTANNITEINSAQLNHYSAAETDRFGKRFAGTPIPTLAELVELLRVWADRRAFIEIKEESTQKFGTKFVVSRIMDQLLPLGSQCIPISYEAAAVEHARALGAKAIGWVAAEWDECSHQTAVRLAPDYLFTNYTRLPDDRAEIWCGPWKWVLYEVTDPEIALALAAKGIEMIETMAIEAMLAHPQLRTCACNGANNGK